MAKNDTPAKPASRAAAAKKPRAKAAETPAKAAASKTSTAAAAGSKTGTKATPAAARKPQAATKSAKGAAASTRAARSKRSVADVAAPVEITAKPARPRTSAQRDAAFDALVRSACLKAGTAAAISSLTRRVPLIGRLAPTVLGPLAETVALAQVQKALVRAIIDLYEVELSDPEQSGVVLLATAANIGAQQLSKRSLDAILKQFGSGLIGTVAARVLPVASILAEITAAVASTYTVGKRAQALCKLPGTGVGNLAELLRGLSGIDQARLLNWSGEAFRLALLPFRSVLGMVWK